MTAIKTDRNLLVGVLGLQLGMFSESQLIDAMQKWIFRKSVSIEMILEELGAIDAQSKAALFKITEQHLKLHNQDPIQSISSLNALEKIRRPLEDLEDMELGSTIAKTGTRSLGSLGTIEPESTCELGLTISEMDRFEILRPHARGGLGVISIAKDRQLHREVALKEIQGRFANDAASQNRFLIEAEITGRLEHPGIVPVYSLGQTNLGTPYYAMRLIRGVSMKSAIADMHRVSQQYHDPGPERELRQLVRRLIDVCNALEYAHSRGVLHRDIKPSNIMLGKFGETLLVDWGLARAGTSQTSRAATDEPTVVPQSGDSASQTQMGSVIGTVGYMSPEQAEGRLDRLSAASDVYSLGATLYCLLTGRSPIETDQQEEMLLSVRMGKIASPASLNKTVPKPLEAICMKALMLNREERYQTASSLAEDLDRWLADEPVSAFPEPMTIRAGRWMKKHRVAVTTTIGMLVTSAIGLAIVAVLIGSQNRVLKDANEKIASAQEQTAQERDTAIAQRDLANQNLNVARTLAMTMLDKAESRLSTGDTSTRALVEVRSDLTELAFENFKKLYDSNSGDRQFTREYAKSARISGNLKRTVRDFDTANQRILLSLELQEQVPADQRSPAESDYLAETHRELGTNLKTAGKLLEANESLQRSIEICESLKKTFPDNLDYVRTIAIARLEQVEIETQRHQFAEASELVAIVIRDFDRLLEAETTNQFDPAFAMFARCNQVEILLRASRLAEGAEKAKEYLALVRERIETRPNDPILPQALVILLSHSAEIELASSGEPSNAIAWLDQCLQTIATLKTKMRSAALIQSEAAAHRLKATAFRKQNRLPESAAAANQAKALADNLLRNVDIPLHNFLMFEVQLEEAQLLEAEGDSANALKRHAEAIVSLTTASTQSPDCVRYGERLKQLVELEPFTNSN